MSEVKIKAKSDGKIYSVSKGNLKIEANDLVLFESDQCQEVGRVISDKDLAYVEDENSKKDLSQSSIVIIRRLNDKDKEQDEARKKEATSGLEKCREIVLKHRLPMELLDADLSFDGKKMTFYFSAPGRVDFRQLVSELASTFQKLIRLQQVGARDRARFTGGVGRCGEQYCCKRFLKGELECINTDMAYIQNIGQMGPNRVTGACGKLMCCLRYELDYYKDMKEILPAIGSELKTDKGKGRVVKQCILKGTVTVELDNKTYLEVTCQK